MKIILLVASFLCLTINGIQPPTDIPAKFIAQGGMDQDEPLEFTPFKEIVKETVESKNPFFLAVVPVADSYSFYNSVGVHRYWQTKDKPYIDPQDLTTPETVFIYQYDGKNQKFPFKYVENETQENIANINFNIWTGTIKEKTANWVVKFLSKQTKRPTLNDLLRIYTILDIPANVDVVDTAYKNNTNSLNRPLAPVVRRYTDQQLKDFLIKIGFPLNPEKLKDRYATRKTKSFYLTYGPNVLSLMEPL